MLWIPKFVYPTGGGTTWELTHAIPERWRPIRRDDGGQSMSAAGVPETYVIHRARLLAVTIRVADSEWGDLQAFLDWWADNATGFDWYPDKDAATHFTCYLDEPAVGERLNPEPDNYLGVWRIPLILRSTSAADLSPAWIP